VRADGTDPSTYATRGTGSKTIDAVPGMSQSRVETIDTNTSFDILCGQPMQLE
jgi:hypothetical protein